MNVGTRELKNRLSYYLRRIREAGEPLYVTDRGELIAELRPVPRTKKKKTSDRDVLLGLAANGDVSLGTGRLKAFRPIKPKPGTSVSRYVIEDRR